MAEQNTITIRFGARGDKDVIDAINKLDKSTMIHDKIIYI